MWGLTRVKEDEISEIICIFRLENTSRENDQTEGLKRVKEDWQQDVAEYRVKETYYIVKRDLL